MSHSPNPGYTSNYDPLNPIQRHSTPPQIPSHTYPSHGAPPPIPANHPYQPQYQPQPQQPSPLGYPIGGPSYYAPPGQPPYPAQWSQPPPAPGPLSQQQQWPPYPPATGSVQQQTPYPDAPGLPWSQSPYPPAPGAPGQQQTPYPPAPGAPDQQQWSSPYPSALGQQWPQPPYPLSGTPQPAYPVSGPLWYLGAPIPTPGQPAASGYNPATDFENVRKATKGFGTNESLLISTLTVLRPLQMDSLTSMFVAKTGKSLLDVLAKEASGWFGSALRGLVLGPLGYDVELVRTALAGVGTNEILLTELILARSAADLRLLASAYSQKYGRELIDAVRGDLSGKTERLFIMALNASPPPDTVPVDQQEVMRDVDALHKAGQGKIGTDEIAFCEIIVNRSQPHLTAICMAYANKYKSLTKVIKSEFSGHMKQSLLYIVEGAKPKHQSDGRGVWRDAKLLEKSMAGLGTKDAMLVWRVLRAQWDPARMQAVRNAYKRRYGKTLEGRVAGETSGAYKKMMVALVGKT